MRLPNEQDLPYTRPRQSGPLGLLGTGKDVEDSGRAGSESIAKGLPRLILGMLPRPSKAAERNVPRQSGGTPTAAVSPLS